MAMRIRHLHVKESDILILARIIEPIKNMHGYRRTPVIIRTAKKQPMHHSSIPQAMKNFTGMGELIFSPVPGVVDPDAVDRWYRHFEEDIHPFCDGNGRLGSLLWNWYRGTLTEPVLAPNFWDAT